MGFLDKIMEWMFENSPTSFVVSTRKICEGFKNSLLLYPDLPDREIALLTLKARYRINPLMSDIEIQDLANSVESFEEFVFITVVKELGEEKIANLSAAGKMDFTRRIMEEIYNHGLENYIFSNFNNGDNQI
ncbi:hypothetical protein KKA87_16160 [bacterium]|nr:hypothetical protein [bacterium]MBU1873616.1 hypothetical protein [bacterium]